MSKYECPTIFRADVSEEETKQLDKFVQDTLTRFGASITKADVWGKRRMAYEINRQRDGYYTIYYFEMEPDGDAVAEMRRLLRTNDSILRSEVIKIPLLAEKHKKHQEEMARKRAERDMREAREAASRTVTADDEEDLSADDEGENDSED